MALEKIEVVDRIEVLETAAYKYAQKPPSWKTASKSVVRFTVTLSPQAMTSAVSATK